MLENPWNATKPIVLIDYINSYFQQDSKGLMVGRFQSTINTGVSTQYCIGDNTTVQYAVNLTSY